MTACTTSSVAPFSSGDVHYSATVACACNDGSIAGIGSSIGPDKATSYTCELGTSTTVAVSTAPAPYHTGTCDLHIFEASTSYEDTLYVQLNITDGANDLLTTANYKLHWGDTARVPATGSKLPYDLYVDFLKKRTVPTRIGRRLVKPPSPVTIDWEDWVVTLTAGITKWSVKDTLQ